MSNDDLSQYLHHIAHLDLPLDCKIELLQVVQNIMRSFVDRAFGEDSAQLARRDGDEFQIDGEGDSLPVVESEDHINTGDKALTLAFAEPAGGAMRKENC